MAAATINLLTAKDSTLYKAAVTDNTGSYQFEKVKSGNYLVKIRSVNFTTWHSSKIDLPFLDINGGYDSRPTQLIFQYRFGNNQVKTAREGKQV
ncbi:MAG: hypothetical protein JWR18_1360 [Segetibacter sp.]|nr:hypothetical protein [Segetibacter sp.]